MRRTRRTRRSELDAWMVILPLLQAMENIRQFPDIGFWYPG